MNNNQRMPSKEKQFQKISNDYHKCFKQKCKPEQKQLDELHKAHKTFIQILSALQSNKDITMDEYFRLLKANSDRIRHHAYQNAVTECKLKKCYDTFYKYTIRYIEVSLQKNISPKLRNTLEKYRDKFKNHKITLHDMIEYNKEMYNNI